MVQKEETGKRAESINTKKNLVIKVEVSCSASRQIDGSDHFHQDQWFGRKKIGINLNMEIQIF